MKSCPILRGITPQGSLTLCTTVKNRALQAACDEIVRLRRLLAERERPSIVEPGACTHPTWTLDERLRRTCARCHEEIGHERP